MDSIKRALEVRSEIKQLMASLPFHERCVINNILKGEYDKIEESERLSTAIDDIQFMNDYIHGKIQIFSQGNKKADTVPDYIERGLSDID